MRPLLQWKRVSVTYSERVFCNLRYPEFSAHASYCLWPAKLYNVFPHYLINGTIFEKDLDTL